MSQQSQLSSQQSQQLQSQQLQQSSTKQLTESPSPTVRVMRLYKPSLYTIPCLQQLSSDELLNDNKRKPTRSPDFTISPFLLLPDSFGEIYLGEFFSAYISVINGLQDMPCLNVTLSARLQTVNATHDLFDSRAIEGQESGRANVLNIGESTDMVVQHTLSELGTHTLRVVVNYIESKTNEPKTIRKFYRFNVLNPLTISIASYDLSDRYMLQCYVKNITKVSVHIQKVQLILPAMSPFDRPKLIHAPTTPHPYKPPSKYPLYDSINNIINGEEDAISIDDVVNIPSIALLNPDESYAYALVVPKKKSSGIPPSIISAARSLGYLEVHWASSMGEHARTCSDEILIGKRVSYPTNNPNINNINISGNNNVSNIPSNQTTPNNNSNNSRKSIDSIGLHGTGSALETRNNTLFLEVIQSPSEGYVGQEFQITIRLTNYYSYPMISQIRSVSEQQLQLQQSQLIIIGLSVLNIPPLDSGESVEITLSVLPLNGGIHTLNGLVAVNTITNLEFIYNNLCTLMIYDETLTNNRWVNE